jgi:hypothetical protein
MARAARKPVPDVTVHHSVYDSRTSQHKNYTVAEVKAARAKLYEAIHNNRHINADAAIPGRETDRKTLDDLIRLMTDAGTMSFLRRANFAGWLFSEEPLEGLDRFVLDRKGAEYEFLDNDLEALRKKLLTSAATFLSSVAHHTFAAGTGPGYRAVPEEWECKRPERFKKAIEELHTGAANLCDSYDELVHVARARLSP